MPITTLTEQIVQAYRTGIPFDADDSPHLANKQQAYQVQLAVAKAMDWYTPETATNRTGYWKVGAPDKVTEPSCAALRAPPSAAIPATVPASKLPRLGVEPEIAFRLGSDLLPGGSTDIASVPVDAFCVCVEVVDSRSKQGMNADPLIKLADHGVHGSLLLGPWQTMRDIDWLQIEAQLLLDGQTVAKATGSHTTGHPLHTMHWLAGHAASMGLPLKKGDVVTTGSWLGLVPIQVGQALTVRFAGLGEVSTQFS